MQILKFGGTSVGNAANINKTIDIILNAVEEDRTIVVASAISGATDKLIEIGNCAASCRDSSEYLNELCKLKERHFELIDNLIPSESGIKVKEYIGTMFQRLEQICRGVSTLNELSRKTLDLIMSFGELLSTKIIEARFNSLGVSCKWVDSREMIKTYYAISQNIVNTKTTDKNIVETFGSSREPASSPVSRIKLFIVPGFIASDDTGRTTTLGRGGSDYTASIIAAATGARILQIWTDVNGMMTSDPRIVPDARTIRHISYKEALELSHFGAKVVYPPTIQPVISKQIPILVKNTFDPKDPGTLIEQNPPEGHNSIKGISSSNKLALLSMEGSGMVGIPGYSSRLFDTLTRNEINIILITQASSVHTMLVAIDEKDASKAKKAVDELFAYEISLGKIEPLKVEKGYSIISLVGDDMKNQSGASGRMFEALGREGINIRAIAQGSSERNVSAVVSTGDVKAATIAVHNDFFGQTNRKIHLFIAGYGNVGRSLLQIISSNRQSIAQSRHTEIIISGLCNSRKMIFGDLCGDFDALLDEGEKYAFGGFLEKAASNNHPDSVFIDCTSDNVISMHYPEIISAGFDIVTCNKIANSSSLSLYQKIRQVTTDCRKRFIYDTNVGAALPIIPTIRQITSSGDKVVSIEAIVSGTLNYIFSQYNGEESFSSIVLKAQQAGYTEPDPRTDLQGTDVLRKAVILARESGMDIEPEEVEIEGFLPLSCLQGSVEDFYKETQCMEAYFKNLCCASGNVQRFLISLDTQSHTVKVGLKSLPCNHPFNQLSGPDAAILIKSEYYPQPILISGAGAGAQVTASGVWRGILSL